MALTHDQEVHLHGLIKQLTLQVSAKYIKGAEEHGGNIWDISPLTLLDHAIEEAIDQCVYLITLREQVTGGPRR